MKKLLFTAAVFASLVFAVTALASVRISPDAYLDLGYNGGSFRAAVSGTYAYGVSGSHFQVYDLSNPLSPALLYSGAQGAGWDVVLYGRYAFTTGSSALFIQDITNPSAPALVTTMSGVYGKRMAIAAHYLLVTTDTSLKVIDISTVAAPVQAGSVALAAAPTAVAVSGNYALTTVGSSLVVVDISNPAAPVVVTSVALNNTAYGVTVQGNYAYATTHGQFCDDEGCTWTNGFLYVMDIANPACPKVLSTTMTPRAAEDVAVSGQFVYTVEQSTDFYGGHWEFLEVNVSNPSAPNLTAYYSSNILNSSAVGLAIAGNYVFLPITTGAMMFIQPQPPIPQCTP